ncbi:hypothetical protein LPJ64_003043, partial [Coemansia asiatica]
MSINALLVISDLEPDDLIGIKTLWLTRKSLVSKGYTNIYIVVCGNADLQKRTWLVNNIAPNQWEELECTYFLGTLARPETDCRLANWSIFAGKLTKYIQDAIILAPCDDIHLVMEHSDCRLENIFNQGGGAPATGMVTFNWVNVELTRNMFKAIEGMDQCSYFLVNSEFVKSDNDGYPYKGGSFNGENSEILHPVLMKDDGIRLIVEKWNQTARSNPRLPAQ